MLGIAKMEPGRGVSLQEFSDPAPREDEVLIKVKISGICGSDLKLYNLAGAEADARLDLPIIIGHEFCGVTESVGSRVTTIKVADRVAGETHVPCMKCFTCQTGNAHICPNQKNVGRTINGSFAEYIALPEVSVRKVPKTLTDHEIAMLEPIGVAVHAVRRSDITGNNILVLGCGPIGLMTIAVAKAFGASRVFATSHTHEKLEKALVMGADDVFNASDEDTPKKILLEAGPRGIGTVIDITGSEDAIRGGLQVLRPGGTMVVAGIPPKDIHFDIVSYTIYKEIKLLGIYGRQLWESWYLSEMLLQEGKINTAPLMGSTYRPEEYGNAFQEAFSGKSGRTFFSFSV